MPVESDQNATDVMAEQELAQGLRGQWESTCEQIAQRILPSYAHQFTGQNRSVTSPNYQNTQEMVDSTGALALKRFAAAMESMNTPHNMTWHGLVPDDPVLLRHREVRLYYEDVTRVLFKLRYASTSNFASQKYCDYLMVGAFGDAILFTDALASRAERGLRYRSVHPGQCYFFENHQGLIDKNFRRFPLTARQAVQQFGAAKVPTVIAEHAADPKRAHTVHFFIHKVAPREDYDPERKDLKGMAYASCYVSVTGKATVREGGYHTFPYAISRYMTIPGEVRGRSIAMMALPTIKTANEIKKTMLKQGHRTVDPLLLAHDDGIVDSFSWKPGSITAGGVNADGKPLVHAIPTGNLAAGDKMLEQEHAILNDWFLVSLFRILVESPQKTATQVIEETREKGMLLTPEMRQQSESLGPMIDRELDVARELNLLPPMPQILVEANGEYKIRYDSPLSRMARAEETSGTMRTIDYWMNYAQVTGNPEPLDHFNIDEIVPETADNQSMPVRFLNGTGKIDQIRKGRAQQAQQQQLLDAAPSGAAIMKQMMPQSAKTA